MTETHLDLDALADLLVGEGSEPHVAHVSGCAACAERLTELDEAQVAVAAALATLPAPPLPAGLADRLLSALDQAQPLPAVEPERARGSTALPPPDEREELLAPGAPADPAGTDPATAAASRTVTPLRRPAPQRRPLPTWLPGAAVAVLVLSAGGLAVATLSDGSGDDSVSSTAGGSADEQAAAPESAAAGVVRNDTGTDYAATPDAFDRLLPGVLAGTAPPAAALSAPAAAPVPTPSGPASTGPEAPTPASTEFRADSSAQTAALDRLRDPAALQGCLSALLPADGSVQPLAVDYAAYAGQPALVVVLSSADPDQVDVYVVGPDCAPGDDRTLFFTRVDRP